MTIDELIQKHSANDYDKSIFRQFAIELLEMVKNSSHLKVVDPGVYVGTLEAQHNYGDTIQTFLDELQKGTP